MTNGNRNENNQLSMWSVQFFHNTISLDPFALSFFLSFLLLLYTITENTTIANPLFFTYFVGSSKSQLNH